MIRSRSLAFSVLAVLTATTTAQADVLDDLFSQGRPVIDLRARIETTDDAAKTMDANAVTLRARLGYETGSWNGLSAQFDVDQVWTIGGHQLSETRQYPGVCSGNLTRPRFAHGCSSVCYGRIWRGDRL